MAGSAPTNNSAVQFEQEQAAEADQKEALRQQRLTQGQQAIDQIFNGTPVMKSTTSPFDWSTFTPPSTNQAMAAWEAANPSAATANIDPTNPGNVPAGYTAVQVAKPATSSGGSRDARAPTSAFGMATPSSGGSRNSTDEWAPTSAATSADSPSTGGMTWALKDASGKIYNQGDPLNVTTQTPTGQTTGGFDDSFFNAYKQKVLDYYNPDEAKQYAEAQRDLGFSLANAGMTNSSVAADKQGELAYQDALQKANIVANANTQEGNLKSQIQANKQSLINQLYSTEDPTLTANLAESSANATRLQDPTLTPAAALFTPALTAVGSAVNGLLYPNAAGGTSAFANSGPTPTSATGTSSDRLYTVH